MRRYSRFQGYAFLGALGVGLAVWGGKKLGEAGTQPHGDADAPAAAAAGAKRA
jgi:hypothetical protein